MWEGELGSRVLKDVVKHMVEKVASIRRGEREDLNDLGSATVESGRDGSGSVCVWRSH